MSDSGIFSSNVQLQEQWAACLATTLFNDYKLGLSDGQMVSLADALIEAVPALIADANAGPLLRRALAENETPAPLDLSWLEATAKYGNRKDDRHSAQTLLDAIRGQKETT